MQDKYFHHITATARHWLPYHRVTRTTPSPGVHWHNFFHVTLTSRGGNGFAWLWRTLVQAQSNLNTFKSTIIRPVVRQICKFESTNDKILECLMVYVAVQYQPLSKFIQGDTFSIVFLWLKYRSQFCPTFQVVLALDLVIEKFYFYEYVLSSQVVVVTNKKNTTTGFLVMRRNLTYNVIRAKTI